VAAGLGRAAGDPGRVGSWRAGDSREYVGVGLIAGGRVAGDGGHGCRRGSRRRRCRVLGGCRRWIAGGVGRMGRRRGRRRRPGGRVWCRRGCDFVGRVVGVGLGRRRRMGRDRFGVGFEVGEGGML